MRVGNRRIDGAAQHIGGVASIVPGQKTERKVGLPKHVTPLAHRIVGAPVLDIVRVGSQPVDVADVGFGDEVIRKIFDVYHLRYRIVIALQAHVIVADVVHHIEKTFVASFYHRSVIEGSNKGFLDMVNYIGNTNMSLQSNYDSVTQMIDIKNFADYFITETYICNIDWLGTYTNNIKYWRTNNPVGKWRYMLWETDLSLGFLPWYDGSDTTNMLGRAINPTVSNPHSIMLKSLLNNTGFRNYFVDRYCDAMNTIFRPYKFIAKSEDLHDEMLPEMSRQLLRWGNQSPMPGMIGRSNDVPSWEYEIDSMQLFMNNRPRSE